MSDKIVLGVETSGDLCSVAWSQNQQILKEYNIKRKNAHATLLAELVDKGFRELKIDPKSVSFVAVASGPGSFTGLRIGMAFAKGFCFGLDIPLVDVTNFEVLADQVKNDTYPLYSLIEARTDTYYTGLFRSDKAILNEKSLLSIDQLDSHIEETDQIVIHEEKNEGHFFKSFTGKTPVFQGKYSASKLCVLGYQKFLNGYQVDLSRLEPLYLQAFAGVL